jgi:hypothetical protein
MSYLQLNNFLKTKGKVPDLILCDFSLPVVDGSELFYFTRSTPLYSSIPFVIKGVAEPIEVLDYCAWSGVIVFPAEQEEFLGIIANSIAHHQIT